jgi:carbohydrate diacid regulator
VPLHLDAEAGEVVIAEPASGEPISPRLAQVLAELVIAHAAVVDQLPNQYELKNKFLHDLLHGSSDSEATLYRQAQIFGMDLSYPRVVILIDAADYILGPTRAGELDSAEAGMHRRAQHVIGSIVDFFELPTDTICAHIGNGEVAVLKAVNRITWIDQADEADFRSSPTWANLSALKHAGNALLRRLRRDTRAAITVGIGRYHPGLPGLARSYQDARAALSLGQRFHGRNRVHSLNELGVAAFIGVSDERTKIDLARYLLSPLDHEPELIGTLQAFLSNNCCPSATSRELSVHRNTLSYRLDKIANLTGLDARRFDDAVQMRIALLLRGL